MRENRQIREVAMRSKNGRKWPQSCLNPVGYCTLKCRDA